MTLDEALTDLIGDEGGYSNNPNDAGGETMWGITVATARAQGYGGAMKDMPIEWAMHIYTSIYWTGENLHLLAKVDQDIAVKVFNAGVNVGTRRVIGWLQTLLNGLNRGQKDYPDVQVDMSLGTATLGSLQSFLKVRGETGKTVLLRGLNIMQGAHYISIATSNQKNEEFIFGWLLNRVQ